MGKQMKSVQINDSKLYDQIVEYCKINGLKVSNLITEMVRKQFMIEKYGDTPFTTYETTIINNNPVSSLTVDVTIEKPNEDESVEIVKNVKTNDEITHPSVVWTPYTIEDKTTLITNGDGNLNKKYIKTRVPSDFYGEIKTESESKVQKPKKRRL
jgi:hypothetical protein